jgi:hypothetical protein
MFCPDNNKVESAVGYPASLVYTQRGKMRQSEPQEKAMHICYTDLCISRTSLTYNTLAW